jgi:hypothetical protein
MALLTLFAAAEASLLSASWFRRRVDRRQDVLLGKENRLLSLRVLDNHLAKQAQHATRLQAFIAKQIATAFRQAVHTRAFEYCVLRFIVSSFDRSRLTIGRIRREVIR